MLEHDEDVIDDLYRHYEQAMYYEAYKILKDPYLAEDAVHEAFLRLIRNRDKVARTESPRARSYVYKTIQSTALDLYRRRKKDREYCCEYDEALPQAAPPAESEELPLSWIAELPEKYASVLRCLFWDGLTVHETAAVLRISEVCVRKRCERARALLRKRHPGGLSKKGAKT